MQLFVLCVLYFFTFVQSAHVPVERYDSNQLVRLLQPSEEQRAALVKWVDEEGLDVWSWSRDVDIRLTPEVEKLISSVFPESQRQALVENIQSLIDGEQHLSSMAMVVEKDQYFTNYHTFDEIVAWMQSLVEKYSDRVELVRLGKTFEGRDMLALRFGGGTASRIQAQRQLNKPTEPVETVGAIGQKVRSIVFHGGQHAREWISVAVVSYLARELIERYGDDETITELVDTFEFTIMPVMNVDGYVFTHERSRLWRKNRQPSNNPRCIGTDPNRNWAFDWNTGGSSGNPCSETYHGPSAFSAPEPKAVADYVLAKQGSVLVYIDFHAYSQLWMTPWGGRCRAAKPADIRVMTEAAQAASSALRSMYGTAFDVQSACDLYQASGGSLDFTYGSGNVTYSYAVELRDKGRFGFVLPVDQIIPSGRETLAGLIALTEYVYNGMKKST